LEVKLTLNLIHLILQRGHNQFIWQAVLTFNP